MRMPGCLDAWMPGCLDAWMPGCLDGWMAGVVGFEPTEWRDQNPLPYHLATPQCHNTLYIIFEKIQVYVRIYIFS